MRFCGQCGLQFDRPVPDDSPGWQKASGGEPGQFHQSSAPIQQSEAVQKVELIWKAPEKVSLIKWSWFGEAWAYFAAAPGVWAASVIIPFVPLILGQALLGGTQAMLRYASNSEGDVSSPGIAVISGGAALLGLFLMLVALVSRIVFSASTAVIANKQVRGQAITINDLFRPGITVWPIVGFTVVYMIMFMIGAVMLYLPALLVVAFVTPGIALVADGVSIGDAITRSFNTLKRDWLGAILFALAWNLLIVVSAIPCGLGLIASFPMAHLLMALLYRDVLGSQTAPMDSMSAGAQ